MADPTKQEIENIAATVAREARKPFVLNVDAPQKSQRRAVRRRAKCCGQRLRQASVI